MTSAEQKINMLQKISLDHFLNIDRQLWTHEPKWEEEKNTQDLYEVPS